MSPGMAADGLSAFRRALILCPHTDDELGCGGTILRLVAAGCDVRYLALSRCEESVPAGFDEDVLERECRAATAALGLVEDHVAIERFRVRMFPQARQEILERLVAENRGYRPDLVLLPCSADIHQDHHTTFEEGLRAFKHSSILGYELPHNLPSFEIGAFVRLEQQQVQHKIRALSCYRSQAHRSYMTEAAIEAVARMRGIQCDAAFAEAFEVVRWIL